MRRHAEEKSVLLLICDISGYTRFMLDNTEARLHGYALIAELMQAIIRQTRVPLRVAKLEGDAVFLYTEIPAYSEKREEFAALLRSRLQQLFGGFEEKLRELVQSNVCTCGGCVHASFLRLKIVVHAGNAVFHRIGRFAELSGVDVILVHRLLKNSLQQDRYLLLTEAAYTLLWSGAEETAEAGLEHYDDLGSVKTFAVAPQTSVLAATSLGYTAWHYKAKNLLRRIFLARVLWLREKWRTGFSRQK